MPARDAMYCALRPPMVNTNSHAQSFVEPPWQMLFSFAGCSVVLEPGDVLWLSADVITQRAGVSSSSLSLRLTTSLPPEMCNESPAARRDDREFFPITERFQTKKKPKQSKPAYFASGNMPDLQRKINQEMAAAYDELMLS